jgi:hypothetical protein
VSSHNNNLTHDPKVPKSPFGEYFLVLSVASRHRRAERKPVHLDMVATASIDPGVRKTMVTYSPENEESFMLDQTPAGS